jgi:hypothetical protein
VGHGIEGGKNQQVNGVHGYHLRSWRIVRVATGV